MTVEREDKNLNELGPNPRARYLFGRNLFQTADPSYSPDSQILIDLHASWLESELERAGIPNASSRYLFGLFDGYRSKSYIRENSEAVNNISNQLRISGDNILQALLWYEAPEFSSWDSPKIKVMAKGMLINADNPNPDRRRQIPAHSLDGVPIFSFHTLSVERQLLSGSFDFVDSERKSIGVKATIDRNSGVMTLDFTGNTWFWGWDQQDNGSMLYRLTFFRSIVKDLYSRIKGNQRGFILVN